MHVEIVTKTGHGNNYILQVPSVKIWEGELPYVPRVGEYIVLDEEFGNEEVLDVTYFFTEFGVCLEIGPDWDGKYARYVKGKG